MNYFQDREVTLDMLLESRDKRHETQMRLLKENPDMTLVCLTVTLPGRIKRNSISEIISKEADRILSLFLGLPVIVNNLTTGYEAYYMTNMPPKDTKKLTCSIEEQHPLGRIFDIDVIDKEGRPIPRTAIGAPQRRCLLCGNEVRFCMRNHTHTQEQLLKRIKEMVEQWQNQHDPACTTSMN